MRKIRIAAAAAALGAACLLFTFPTGAGAAGPPATTLDSYSMHGKARGLTITFGFQNFVIPTILDVGVPHAVSNLTSAASGQALSEASQAYPGDVIAGATDPQFPGGFPGYKHVAYPPGGKIDTETTSSLFGHDTNIPSQLGPIAMEKGHLLVSAAADNSTSRVTSQRVAFGPVDITSIQSSSVSTVTTSAGSTVTRTIIHGITIAPSPMLTIKIGTLVSEATATSDGNQGDGSAALNLSDVRVISGGTTFAATIDQDGVHVTGPVPGQVPSSLDQSLTLGVSGALSDLTNSGVTIRTAKAVKIINGSQSETGIGGLLIIINGQIPDVTYPAVLNQVLAPIYDRFPVFCPPIPNFPVCITPAVIPGPGVGGVTTISIGNVDAIAAANGSIVSEVPGGGTTTGLTTGAAFNPGTTGAPFPTTTGGGTTTGGTTGTTGTPQQTRLFGLVARMPSGALTGTGLGFLVVAVALGIGPSLRRWRSAA